MGFANILVGELLLLQNSKFLLQGLLSVASIFNLRNGLLFIGGVDLLELRVFLREEGKSLLRLGEFNVDSSLGFVSRSTRSSGLEKFLCERSSVSNSETWAARPAWAA